MKRTTTLLIAMLLAMSLSAQYYYLPFINAGENPGNLNQDPEYPVGGGISPGWTSILGGSQSNPAWSPMQTIPIDFLFNGDTVTTFFVSSSGVLTFADSVGTVPPHTNATIPSNLIPDNSVMVWGLAAPGANDEIVTKTFGTAPNRQFWIHFSSYGYDLALATAWVYWSIVLEENTNNIYIVDQRAGNNANSGFTLGIQLDATNAVQVIGSPNIENQAGTDPTAADNSYYQFVFGTQNQYDVAMNSLDLGQYLDIANAPFNIQGNLSNMGTETIQSVTLNYSVNNGTPVTSAITNLSTGMFADTTLVSATPWMPAGSGQYELKIWVTDINGNPDQNNSNDTATLAVTVMDTIITKMVLIEQGTGAWCQFCPDGTVIMNDILQTLNNTIGVTIHNGDAMAFADGNTVNSAFISGYPGGMIDRYKFPDMAGVGFSRGQWKAKTIERLATPVPVHVSATHTYNMSTRQLSATVRVEFFEDMTGEFRINCHVIEDSLTGTGQGWNQANAYNSTPGHPFQGAGNPIVGYVHNHVTRTMLGGPWGAAGTIPNTVTKGAVYEQTFNYTLPSVLKPQHISIVPLLQMYSANPNEREILNAQKYDLDYHVGMEEEISLFEYVNIYPNPAGNHLNVDMALTAANKVKLEVTNMMGQVVITENIGNVPAGQKLVTINTSDLADGYYVIRLISDNKAEVFPFIKRR
jgi:hypothetical protein